MSSQAIQKVQLGIWAAVLSAVLTVFGIIGCRTITRQAEKKEAVADEAPTPLHDACGKIALRRNWQAFPATLQLKEYSGTLFAVGDVHGDFLNFQKLLVSAKVIALTGPLPTDFVWLGGKSVFVQLGDIINKGDDSVNVLKLAMSLEAKAKAAGGLAIFVAGNHEIGFVAAPFDPKYSALRKELSGKRMGPCSEDFSPTESIGAWLRNRPAAVEVNGIFLSHSGWSQNRSLADIGLQYEKFIDSNNWDNEFSCGNHDPKAATEGFFNAERWWGDSGEQFESALAALSVKQIVFGHDPGAFGMKGQVGGVFANPQGRALVKIDAGMWQQDSTGVLLRCSSWLVGGGCAKFETKKSESSDFEALPLLQGPPELPKKTKAPRLGC